MIILLLLAARLYLFSVLRFPIGLVITPPLMLLIGHFIDAIAYSLHTYTPFRHWGYFLRYGAMLYAFASDAAIFASFIFIYYWLSHFFFIREQHLPLMIFHAISLPFFFTPYFHYCHLIIFSPFSLRCLFDYSIIFIFRHDDLISISFVFWLYFD